MEVLTNEPVMKTALGEDWLRLDEAVRRHYDLTPGREAAVRMQGIMQEVDHSHIAKLYLLPGRIFGALLPYKGENVTASVRNWTTSTDQKAMFWHRVFDFGAGRKAVFASRMEYVGGDEIIEYVRFGLGIRMKLSVENGALKYRSTGYQWDIGAVKLPIPTWLILGDGEITETGISATEFSMSFRMRHPLFGKTFSYSGSFRLEEDQVE